jgi:hypothetical protein
MVTGQPRLRTTAFQVFDGVWALVATATSGTGIPKIYRVTLGLKAETAYVFELIGAQGQNRSIRQERIETAEGWPEGRKPGRVFVTADTGIFNVDTIKN